MLTNKSTSIIISSLFKFKSNHYSSSLISDTCRRRDHYSANDETLSKTSINAAQTEAFCLNPKAKNGGILEKCTFLKLLFVNGTQHTHQHQGRMRISSS